MHALFEDKIERSGLAFSSQLCFIRCTEMHQSAQTNADTVIFHSAKGGQHSTMDSATAFYPAGPGSNLGSGCSDVAELINCIALLRVRADSAKLNMYSCSNPSSTSESSTAKKHFIQLLGNAISFFCLLHERSAIYCPLMN